MDEKDINEERLELALEAAGLDLWENDLITGEVPRKAVKIFEELGYNREEASSSVADLFTIIHPDDVLMVRSAINSHLAGVTPQYRCEFRIRAKNGSWVWYANYGRIIDRGSSNAGHRFMGVTFCIDDRKRKEVEYERLNRALSLVSKTASVLIRVNDEKILFSEICKLAVGTGGYLLAWVGIAENDVAKSVRPVAQFGFEARYLDNLNITWADTELGRGPAGTAIRTRTSVPLQDIQADPEMFPWREAALQRGFRSCIALPLIFDDHTVGALVIYSVEPHSFNKAEVALLEELANDLSYGVKALRTRIAHEGSQVALRESEQRYRSLFNNAEVAMFRTRLDGSATLDCNEKFLEIVGSTRSEVIGKPSAIFWNSSLRRTEMVRQLKALGRVIDFDFEMLTPKGELRHCLTSIRLYPESGLLEGSVRDITLQKQAENALLRSESRLRAMLENDLIGIVTYKDRIIQWANPAYEKLLGYEKGELNGVSSQNTFPDVETYLNLEKNAYPVIDAGKIYRTELICQRKNGSLITVDLSGSFLPETGETLWACVDISKRKKIEAELSLIAHYDSLTGVPNRVLLADRMKQAIAQTSREQNMMAVCYLDLDGFKPINDSLGHDAGDSLLIEIASRIVNTVRGGDTVARLGGDEFVVLLLGLEKGEECVVTLERLLAAIAEPVTVKNKINSVSASIGVSIYPLDDEDPDTLLRHADQAMYVAKQSGKNRFHIYDVELDKRTKYQGEFIKNIQNGLEQDQFELHYQPLVNMRSRKLIGVEALIRWRHPERGLLSPAEFLRQVENTDLDIKIGEWVIATALAQLKHWQNIGLNIEVGINISGYHLESTSFVDNLRTQLSKYSDLPRGKLIIEVLETVALNDISAIQGVIESCGIMGVGFALDDFGTGYSSLAYLSSLSVDVLKIDQSFVRDMLTNKKDMAIVQGIIALAKAFEIHTVAEGIETDENYQALLEMGCEFGQGYCIARPMTANELIAWQSSYR